MQSVHIMDGFSISPSFGLMCTHNDKNFYFTTDTQFCPEQIREFYKMADIIFHDFELTHFKSGVHANIQDLQTLPDEIKKKIRLVHYQDNINLSQFSNLGFAGFVPKGHTDIF